MATISPFVEVGAFKGINNVDDTISFGAGFLSEANNVDIDNQSLISRRSGYTLKLAGNFQSIFGGSNILLAVKDGNLVEVDDDFSSYNILHSNVGTLPMSYVEVNNKIYYTNGIVIGYVQNGESYQLKEPAETGRSKLPAGHIIEYYHGRLYTAKGNVIYYSDAMNLEQIQTRKNFIQLNSRIAMLKAVRDGLYTADGSIKFLSGMIPNEFSVNILSNYNVIENTAVRMDGSYLNLGNPIDGKVIYMATERGFAIGMNGGQFINLTSKYYSDINGARGSGVYITEQDKNKYLVIIS